MSENCFVREVATPELMTNVTNFCSECYNPLQECETVFYDMKNYRYLCEMCKNRLQERLDENCEIIQTDTTSLFSNN